MDTDGDILDFVKLINVKSSIENITPHKIAVVAFIREYGLLKMEAKKLVGCTIAPKYRKDFCMLALKLIQCPDMEFKELETLLTDGHYNLLSVHLQNFCVRLQNIYVNGINALTDCVTTTFDKLIIEHTETYPCIITRYSVLGRYLRRILLHLETLTFIQTVALYKAFCLYYQRGRPGLMMRSLSKEKLNNMEAQVNTSTSPITPDDPKTLEFSIKMNLVDKDNSFEEGQQWSRKQAELFTAQQANLLQINEKKALPPRQMQKIIMQIVNDIPEYPDIHYLSFLNCIRMKEFCGAQDSLYNCFDRTVFSVSGLMSNSDRNKNFRYAALNRSAMHIHFGHKTLAAEAAREAVGRAHEAADSVSVATATAWGALAGGRARRAALMSRAPRPSRPANSPHHPHHSQQTQTAQPPNPPRQTASAAQLTAQHAAVTGAIPAQVFQVITKGDTLNYLHSMTDLTAAGLANTAALWSLYGKTEMASVTCQLLLNLNMKCSVGSESAWQWSDANATAASGAAGAAAWRGLVSVPAAIAAHFPSSYTKTIADRCHAELALRAGKWEEAEQSVRRLASSDRWESQLLRAEMYFIKGDAMEALDCLSDILDLCKTEDDSPHYMYLRVKAMILMSEVQQSFSSVQSSNVMLLNEALSLAKKYHLHHLAVTVEMHIANAQLNMGCAKNALNLVRKVLPTVMAHSSAYDVARALLLYTKCRVATAPTAGEIRTRVLQSCCDALETVKTNFSKVGAHSRLLQTWYLQAQLYNEIGNHGARNQCAWMYRQLEQQHPIEPSSMLLVMY